MSWFGPQDCNCLCGSFCDCASSAEHELDDLEYTKPTGGTGNAAVKITIAGMPALFEWDSVVTSGTSSQQWEFKIEKLDELNGTYYYEFDGACIPTSLGTYGEKVSLLPSPLVIKHNTTRSYILTEYFTGTCSIDSGPTASTPDTDPVNLRLFFDRTVLNDITISLEMAGGWSGGPLVPTQVPAGIESTASIKCSLDFTANTAGVTISLGGNTDQSAAPCSLVVNPDTGFPGIYTLPGASLKIELVRL